LADSDHKPPASF